MFTSGLKESQWTEEDGRTVQVDFYEDDDIDDEDDDDDDWWRVKNCQKQAVKTNRNWFL